MYYKRDGTWDGEYSHMISWVFPEMGIWFVIQAITALPIYLGFVLLAEAPLVYLWWGFLATMFVATSTLWWMKRAYRLNREGRFENSGFGQNVLGPVIMDAFFKSFTFLFLCVIGVLIIGIAQTITEVLPRPKRT